MQKNAPVKMNLLSKLYQKEFVDMLGRTDFTNGSENPLIIELDTTEACDLACPGCISEDIMKTNNRFSNQRLMELASEFYDAGVKGVILIGGGEPLAHPAIGQFMDFLGTHDIHIGITTNGTFIHKYIESIAKYSHWTRVSMDAATTDTFNILRPSKGGKPQFDRIVDNMRRLAEIKTGTLGYSFLIQTPNDGANVRSNIHEIYDAAKLAKDIGCDYFEVKPSYQFREGIDHALIVHDSAMMRAARDEIARLSDLVSDDFSIMKAINLDFSLSGQQQTQPKTYTNCPVAELRTLVCPSGSFVCPYWRGKEKMQIGNLNHLAFSDMWKGDLRKQVMQKLDPSKDCTFHCLRHESNMEIIHLVDRIAKKETITTVDEFDRFI